MLRGAGLPWDLRRTFAYEQYSRFEFSIASGLNGDCFDRYLIRIHEMRESLLIINQALDFILGGRTSFDDHKFTPRHGG